MTTEIVIFTELSLQISVIFFLFPHNQKQQKLAIFFRFQHRITIKVSTDSNSYPSILVLRLRNN